MPDPDPQFTHTTRPGGTGARCGARSGPVEPWDHVVDPQHPACFDCPDCWQDVAAAGEQPMGGACGGR